jgi:hypothetical protein
MQFSADTCRAIMCGAVTQAQAGRELVYECAAAGMVGALPCTSPRCEGVENLGPGCNPFPAPPADIPVNDLTPFHPDMLADQPIEVINQTPITPYNLVTPLPSITNNLPDAGPESNPAGCGFAGWVSDNPLLAAGLVLAAAWAVRK